MAVWLLHSNEPTLHLLLERLALPHGNHYPSLGQDVVCIHWGSGHKDSPGRRVLQPVDSIVRAEAPRTLKRILRLHGVSFSAAPDKLRLTHEYLIPVFHLQALALFKKAAGVFYGALNPFQPKGKTEFEEMNVETPPYHAARAKREAVKAIYALGLDYGVVRIGVRPEGELVVLELQAVPILTPRLAELFADAMRRFAEELATLPKQTDAMLGADPEFVLRDERGKVAFASRFMERAGPVGCDAIVLPGFRKVYPLVELRPEPSREVGELVANLRHTMKLARLTIPDTGLAWLAGGMPVHGFPLGGHIHFSGVWLNGELLRALDNYLALPLVLLENTTTGLRKPKYGFLGDFRRQSHGGFEYRVLPSWMVSPTLAHGVLALAKLVADHYSLLSARPLNQIRLQKAYYSGDKAFIRPLVPSLLSDVLRLSDYHRYKKYIAPLQTMLMRAEAWNEQADIREQWAIGPFARKEESSNRF
ncbi:putative amidoligase domain-containing protein [Paenibacillus xerothermodurans]|uniref:Phage phiEco32-like COOH-NH2 ligase-type 2 n=1 Tax=Paenibacillus xerothermodurans TaxID=1977292 RepID=A0A2W1P4V8_PAEXE|nr:hypothetical protein [Paenibacillus xerothermodurans]PZE22198.1 hypothetical protein CBW46_005490 [Paenibacillus xerothermodurans]